MKLFSLALLSLLSYHCCNGYPVIESKLSEDLLLENGISIEPWFDTSNETASNDSSPLDMHGFGKNVVNKVKEGIKTVRDEEKDVFDKVKDFLLENGTSIEYWFDASNETASNDSSPLDMRGFGKKVVTKVKEGIKTVKDKIKGGIDKVKNKIKDFKDKIGSKGGSGGGGSGGGYYRDKYNRDYDRDRYNRDYNRRDSDYKGGSGISDPNAKWFGLGIGIFMIVGILGTLIYYKVKGDI